MTPYELRDDGWTDAQPPLDGPNALMVADDAGWFWWKYAPASKEVADWAAGAAGGANPAHKKGENG